MSEEVDLFVIGAGSGGVRAARIASGYGAKVTIAEEYRFGGTCVIRGCVPKKLLVYASRFHDELGDASLWPELFDANAGRTFEDGRTLVDPRLLQPGWDLIVAVDAREHDAPEPPVVATIDEPSAPSSSARSASCGVVFSSLAAVATAPALDTVFAEEDPIARLERKVDAALQQIAALQHTIESLDATLARVLAR